MNKVLITGGSGLIGRMLAKELDKEGYKISILGRNKYNQDKNSYTHYNWDIEKGNIDSEAVKNVECIVHLAGENISEKKWSPTQKIIIENSRVKSAKLLYQACLEQKVWPKTFISSSAIGYYGTFTSDKILTEEDGPGSDFLAEIGKKWESAADLFKQKGIRTVKIRTGVVLSKDGAAYPKMAKPAKFGLAAAFGSGKQYVPWIHIHDIVNIFTKAIEDEKMHGAYNGVAPQHLTNKELTKAIAKSFNKPYWLPNIPEFILKAVFGEMSDIILKGSRISAEKIKASGYTFKFSEIEDALKELSTKI
ncbi:MAG: TIGR01777 family oxidoreductase [Bacteroidales bacterium]|nr:TIGR01777 family oxidoreductase [Bacteroidales bacterium]